MTHRLFPTLIYHEALAAKVTTLKLNRQIRHEVKVLMQDDRLGQAWSKKNYRHGFTSYASVSNLYAVSPTFFDLGKRMDAHLRRYLKQLGVDIQLQDLQLNSLWANYMPPGAYHTSHIHPTSVISGTYYVEVPPGASPLKIEDPRLNFMMNSPPIKESAKPELQRFYSLQPKAGDLVFFESWLRHEVPENEAKTARISISFNYDWRGRAPLC